MPSLELLTSASAARLMDEAVSRTLALARGDARVVVVAPTVRLLDALRRAVLAGSGSGGVVANVTLLHHRALAAAALDLAYLHGLRPAPPPRLLGELESEAILRRALEGLPKTSALRELCAQRPRFVPSLLRTITELREARARPAALKEHEDLAALLAAHDRLLSASAPDAVDAAGHALAGAESLRALAGASLLPWTHLVHHGSYELVGTQSALVDALARAVPTVVLAPSGPGPAHATSRAALARWPAVPAAPLDPGASTLVDVAALFDEDGAPRFLPPEGAVSAWHVRGARAEAELAARLAADAHLNRGVPLEDIAVVARSLEPFAAHLRAAFDAQGVPFTTSATEPLLRHPWAQALLALVESLATGLPRRATMELLRSPWAILRDKTHDPRDVTPDLWDEWTLRAGIVRGVEALAQDALAWHEADLAEQARRRETTVEELAARAWALTRARRLRALADVAQRLEQERLTWRACRTHAEHARFVRGLVDRWLAAPTDALGARVGDAALEPVDELARLDAWSVEATTSADAVRSLLERAWRGAAMPIRPRDGGVRVLSAMPARALPFRVVVLLGLNQGSFPRRPRHDPFLGDDARRDLRASAPSLGVKSEARREERELLALLLGSATEVLHVTWQRADENGKARTPSLFLREIARVAGGRPDVTALTHRDAADAPLGRQLPLTAVAGHPAQAARQVRERFGTSPFRDALLEAAERRHRRRAVRAIAEGTGRLDAALDDALETLGLLESFEIAKDPAARAQALSFDGLLGPGVVPVPERLSASSLQLFGSCALHWLFERGLGIEERDEEADELSLDDRDMGVLVHSALEALNLHAMSHGGDPRHLATPQGLAALRGQWERGLSALAGARREHAPLLWDSVSRRWLSALERFAAADASRLARAGARVLAAEMSLSAVVTVRHDGRSVELPLAGRVDRILRTSEGLRVEDYKSSRDVHRHADKAAVLKGHRLQGLAYRLLGLAWAKDNGLGETVDVSFVAVHPDVEPVAESRLDLAGFDASWSETLVVLEQALRSGAFALKKNGCDGCAFTAACRRDHGPTRGRLAQVEEMRDYADLSRKHTKLASLRAVRESAAALPDEEEP